MLTEAGMAESLDSAREKLMDSIRSGAALEKLARMVEAQGGDPRAVYDTGLLPEAAVKLPVTAERAGYVRRIHAEQAGPCVHASGRRPGHQGRVIDLVRRPDSG